MMVEEDFPTSFSARLARKDAGLVLDAAEAHDLRMRIAEAVVARFDETIQAMVKRIWGCLQGCKARARLTGPGAWEYNPSVNSEENVHG
jgi:hypothetical protein